MTNLEFVKVETLLETKMSDNSQEQIFRVVLATIGAVLITQNSPGTFFDFLLVIVVVLIEIWCAIGLTKLWEEKKGIETMQKAWEALYNDGIEVEEAIKQLGLLPEPEKTSETK